MCPVKVHVVCCIVVLSSGDSKLTVHVVCCIVVLSSGDSKLTLHTYIYTECPRRNVKYFGRVFLMLNYTDITQNTYIQS